jgi:hypothetical protein
MRYRNISRPVFAKFEKFREIYDPRVLASFVTRGAHYVKNKNNKAPQLRILCTIMIPAERILTGF